MAIFPMDDPQYVSTYAEESAMVDASELIAEALEESGMSQADLARALKVSRSEITARLRGERNITVRSLAATLHAMGRRIDFACALEPVDLRAHVLSVWRPAIEDEPAGNESNVVAVGGWARRR
jgi:transcriptional regulator with XRE-family HTH domain